MDLPDNRNERSNLECPHRERSTSGHSTVPETQNEHGAEKRHGQWEDKDH